jgi:hypothetical protein
MVECSESQSPPHLPLQRFEPLRQVSLDALEVRLSRAGLGDLCHVGCAADGHRSTPQLQVQQASVECLL